MLAEQIVDDPAPRRGRARARCRPGGELEQFAGEMRHAARSGRGEVELAGLRFGERQKLLHVVAGTSVATTSIPAPSRPR